ncbi:MAG: DUF4926 domain-containing protein [Vicinamibacterales bacterium]
MLEEHESAVLTEPVPSERLEAGDVGTVVHVYGGGLPYEVEFTAVGGTAAVVTVESSAIHPDL